MVRRSLLDAAGWIPKVLLAAMMLTQWGNRDVQAEETVSVVADDLLGSGSRHGLNQIVSALKAKGVSVKCGATLEDARGARLIVTGIATGPGTAARLLKDFDIPAPTKAEGFVVRQVKWKGRPTLVVSSADDRGLMYAELTVADRIGWAVDPNEPLSEIQDTREQPAVVERALSKVVMNQSEFERYFFSEAYWAKYLDMLARNRYNTLVLMFGYSAAGYFDPPYPFLFDVDGFREVRVVGITEQQQQRNLDALNRIVQMTHERGLKFTLAIWTHINRRVRKETLGTVWGLTDENLIPYTKAALKKFLERVPDLDAVQFRVHVESSVSLPQQVSFWRTVLKVIKDSGKAIRVDMRAKGFTDDMIEAALASGVNIRLTTKYWGEQMGLPFHPTHLTGRNQFRRRHGYADLLRYPHKYKMHYRLWNLGTTRVLLWGDPDYVRRFADSTHLWEGEGFEVHEPLAFKMGHHRGETYDLLRPDYRYYDWEFERYWYFYQVFGRVGYAPDAFSRIDGKEFESRFGREAGPYVMRAIHKASRILPRIVAYNLRDLSADYAWAEKQRWNDLATYAMAEPSDTAQFLGIEEAARYHLEGGESARIWPQQTSDWFARTSAEVLDLIDQAEKRIGSGRNKEFVSTMVDLRVLAGLARYHAQRIHAGLQWSLFSYAGDLHALQRAIGHERNAVTSWEEIVKLTEDVYHDDLIMGRGPRLTGSWKSELAELKKGLQNLEQKQKDFRPDHRQVVAQFDFGSGRVEEGFRRVGSKTRYDRTKGGYGWWHAHLSPSPTWLQSPLERERERDFVHGPEPMSYTYSAFTADLPNGHYELTFTMVDRSGKPRDYGPMWIVANGIDSTGRFVVPAGQRVEKTVKTSVTDNRLNMVFNSASDAKWMANSLIVTRLEPRIAHIPVRKTSPGEDVVIRATISGPDPLTRVRVGCGSAKQGYTYRAMKNTGGLLYETVIPQTGAVGGLEYFIEAADRGGRTVTFPREGRSQPIALVVTDDRQPPSVSHSPVKSCATGEPLAITADVQDPSGIKWARLRYRGVNQHQDFRTLRMLPTGKGHEYRVEIPAEHIRPEWDLMYLIEVMDNKGNGRIHPDLERETPYIVVKIRRSSG